MIGNLRISYHDSYSHLNSCGSCAPLYRAVRLALSAPAHRSGG